MKSGRIAVVAFVTLSAIATRIMFADSPTLQASELEKLRGGNSNQMSCTATCNHLNDFDTPCANKSQGASCFICSGGNYTYSTQVTNPVPSGCTANNTGFQSDPMNNTQGCGFKSMQATCQTQGTGLVCKGGMNSTDKCTGSVVIQAQPIQPPPPG
jgi:hypothetical protein